MPAPRPLPLLLIACVASCTADKGVHFYDGLDSGAESAPPESGSTDSEPGPDGDSGGPHGQVTEEELGDSDAAYNPVAVLFIDAYGAIGDGDKADGWLTVVREHDGTLEDIERAPVVYEGPIGIEIHGASSSADPKHNYRMELRDATGADYDYPLLGLGSDSDYVLHASYGDKSYLRNPFIYSLGRAIGDETGEWQPGVAFAEVYLNGRYWGLYAVIERQKRDAQRIDIPEPAAGVDLGDITGGYIFKVDYDRGLYFRTAAGTLLEYGDPRHDEISAAQDAYVKAWWDSFESMLNGASWSDADAGYPAWIDQESWLDYFLLNELAHNVDAYRLSTYVYKDVDAEGGRLHAGPIWDFDRAFGNVNYCECYNTGGWIFDDLAACGASYQYPLWWQKVWSDPAFQDALRCRWETLRAGPLSEAEITERMAALAEPLGDAVDRDQSVWGTIGVNVGFNYFVGETWEEELDWLREWTLTRADWLDRNLSGTCAD